MKNTCTKCKAHKSSWANAASILVRPLHEGVLPGVSLGKTQAMILDLRPDRIAKIRRTNEKRWASKNFRP
jgi:hypothetical protein